MMSNVTRKLGIPLYGPYERTLLDIDNENWAYAHPQLGTGVLVLFENATWDSSAPGTTMSLIIV